MSLTLPKLQLPSYTEAEDPPKSIGDLSLNFLEDLKARFGDQSPQSKNIHEALGAFRRGELSKRKVHATILDVLESHDDLRQGLMDILVHPEARWTPGDFNLPAEPQIQAFQELSPQFLQPEHQLQMRLPSISPSWFPLPQIDQTVDTETINDYKGSGSHYDRPSSHKLPLPAPYQPPHLPMRTWEDNSGDATYALFNDTRNLPSTTYSDFRSPWEELKCDETWESNMVATSDILYDEQHYQQHGSPTFTYTDNVQSMIHSNEMGSDLGSNTYQQDISQVLHTPLLSYEPLQPPIDHSPGHSVFDMQYAQSDQASPSPVVDTLQDGQRVEEGTEEPKEDGEVNHSRNHSLRGPFIHVLCGKGFAAPSKVKKHHWGKKQNDLATTTGCWAKYNKPNVAWDDHPSCKSSPSRSETTKLVPSMSRKVKPKAVTSQPEIRVASNGSQYRNIPDIPALHDLPHIVAGILSTGTAIDPSTQALRKHHHHQLASRSSFDSLLTAINMVSQIDAPKPQGRADSVALHLDAQVSAAERYNWDDRSSPFASLPYGSSFDTRFRYSVMSTTLETNASRVQASSLDSPLPDQNGRHSSLLLSDIEDSYAAAAFSQLFKPAETPLLGPMRKRRKL